MSDPQAMRALAHPLRLDLLEVLSTAGPATAAWCGRALGVPQANCSFHLRQLAKYGFVEEADSGTDRRERKWRLVEGDREFRFDLSGAEAAAGEGAGAGGVAAREAVAAGAVARQVERTVVEREMAAILEYAGRRAEEGPEWRGRAGMVSALAVVSAEDLSEIERKWTELLAPYVVRADARRAGDGEGRSASGGSPEGPAEGAREPERRLVRYFMAATPLAAPDAMTGYPAAAGPDPAPAGPDPEPEPDSTHESAAESAGKGDRDGGK
ncbi:Helix-turn-helix domain-containing protein [Actinacidiphila yanglinensis]|uniref:Helix-turn-helix domain-containing protein n=1 Tax=Actinacidiphila yanglinensis TaxID=310779 RepID=A0A1H5YVC0_9ACTN|nr:helix-turn-helix domain-containing protein [Actinacidiphila yanglinensis]SEG27226.1 Helix-turn-helix domain-containing protein [Actinacidiphila yanglinensis]